MGEREIRLINSPADLPQDTYGTNRPKQYPCLAFCVDVREQETFFGSHLLTRWEYVHLEDVIPLLEEIGRRGTEQDDGSDGDEGGP
jgi:hypothetical protein